MRKFLQKYQKFRPFSGEEAWTLFRLAAFGEAAGWTLLITGLLVKHFVTPGNNIPVLLAGQVHGILFLLYITAAAGLSPSLGWSGRRILAAGLCSVPPYGSLLYEMYASHYRKINQLKTLGHSLALIHLYPLGLSTY